MRKLFFTLAALLMVSAAWADDYLYIEDFRVSESELGTEITVPVKAHFDAYVSAWQVWINCPAGIEFIGGEEGPAMIIPGYNKNGEAVNHYVALMQSSGYNKFIAASAEADYQMINGFLTPVGCAKWAPGEFEMLNLRLKVSENFQGGQIYVITEPTCSGSDPRGEVCPKGQHHEVPCNVTFDNGAPIQTPAPDIVVTPGDEAYVFQGVGEGTVRLYIDETEVNNPYTVVRTHEDKMVKLTAVAHVDGQIDGTVVCEYYIPALSVPETIEDPVITFIPANDNLSVQVNVTCATEGATLFVNGENVGTGAYSWTERRNSVYEAKTVNVTAKAVKGNLVSNEVSDSYVFVAQEKTKADAPTFEVEDFDTYVKVTVTFYGNGNPVLFNTETERDLPNPFTVNKTYEGQIYHFTAYNEESEDQRQSYILNAEIQISAMTKPTATTPRISFVETKDGGEVVSVEVVVEDATEYQVLVNGEQLRGEVIYATYTEVKNIRVEAVNAPGEPYIAAYAEADYILAKLAQTASEAATFRTEMDDDYVYVYAEGSNVVLFDEFGQEVDPQPYAIARAEYDPEGSSNAYVYVTATTQQEGEQYAPTTTGYTVVVPMKDKSETDPHATGWWIVIKNAESELEWYELNQGTDGSWVTTVTLNYGDYGTFYWDPELSAAENNLNRPNVPYYFVVDGQTWGAPEADKATLMGEAAHTMSNPLYENENSYTVPVGYSYVLGIYVDPSEDDQLEDGTWYYVYCAQGPQTDVDELNAAKTVAGVRYYNLMGQEMQEANGMTIVVTTYTDGTTSAVKVMK